MDLTFSVAAVFAATGEETTMMCFSTFVAIVVAWTAMVVYNKINPLRHRTHEAEANTEVAMQKRIRLANELIGVASQYANHEALIQLRISDDRKGQTAYYQRSGKAIAFVAQMAATFPALRADQTYLRLMGDVSALETDLQNRYEVYNASAREYNEKRTGFPAILFADLLGFRNAPYLDPSLWHPR